MIFETSQIRNCHPSSAHITDMSMPEDPDLPTLHLDLFINNICPIPNWTHSPPSPRCRPEWWQTFSGLGKVRKKCMGNHCAPLLAAFSPGDWRWDISSLRSFFDPFSLSDIPVVVVSCSPCLRAAKSGKPTFRELRATRKICLQLKKKFEIQHLLFQWSFNRAWILSKA